MVRRISVDDICCSIEFLFARGYPLIEEVAQVLSVSSRSIHRLLQNEGVSYSELVDKCRCQTACDALEHTRDPVREIADFLGYRDVASFSRAFRRWTGKPPHAYRNFLSEPES